MRLVHLSDIHLGFRQYQRLTAAGINQREADVARVFSRAIDRVIELQPDLVLLAGDVFHNVRPTNPAIIHAFRQLSRLVQMLPDVRIVMVAGNHDKPRTSETGCLLKLFEPLGIDVVDNTPLGIPIPELDLYVLAVPDITDAAPPLLRPQGNAKYNVLLMHGEIEGLIPHHLGVGDREPMEISKEQLGAQAWSYVALGHYHVYREVAPNAYYSGSLEYTSTTIWGEVAEEERTGIAGKGFIERDLATGKHAFHSIPTRRVIDLPAIEARGMTSSELDAVIRKTVEKCDGGIEDCVVRLIARDVPRHVARELDHKALREYKRSALHFHFDARRPEVIRIHGSAAPGRRASLTELVREGLRSRPIDAEIDREELVAAGVEYLRQAESVEQVLAPEESE